ncbi:alpha/beta hydrolase [Planctomicrobium sp. SH668]|uniref:alpha/beta hydrolase n=1 Tax=Planctomicrobium sp. SH668 TaxID=3448126 RepID=UPI003F5C21D1
MNRLLGFLSFLSLFTVMSATTMAAGPEPIPLWADGAPDAKGTEKEDVPVIRIYPADAATSTGAMVVVLPGGGYGALAVDHEGHQVAKWLNRIGVSAAVVNYRLGPKYNHPAPLQDAQRGIRYVRAHAEELKIDPNRVGIMGFSAGGHLASTVSTHFDAGDSASADPIAKQSSRPNFSILCYPVISLKESFSHGGSRRNLLGESPDPALVESLSNETQVTKETPPTFIFQTDEDPGVPAENAIAYYLALRKNKVPAELHVYQNGPHGVGLAPNDPVLSTWTDRLHDWLKVNGFLNPVKRAGASGKVSLNGEPLRWGAISFLPKDPTAPTSFAMISNGGFGFHPSNGLAVGEHRVSVVSLGSVVPYPTIEDVLYLTGSDEQAPLTIQVSEGGNELNFDLLKRD